jgi:hypothetical protein
MKMATLERKARAAIKNHPEARKLDRKKIMVGKGLATGKYSTRQAAVMKSCLRRIRQILLLQKIYKSMRAKG